MEAKANRIAEVCLKTHKFCFNSHKNCSIHFIFSYYLGMCATDSFQMEVKMH